MKKHLDTRTPDGIKDIVDFLNQFPDSIKVEDIIETPGFVFNRKVKFMINDTKYVITWYVNESTITIGESNRSPRYTFKHVWFDTTFPLVGGNKSLAFSHDILEGENIRYGNKQPYDSFRIPI